MSPDPVGSIGIFRGRTTRDATAIARDGDRFVAINRLDEANRGEGERSLYEVQFTDGFWMLVREDDLVTGAIGRPS